MLNYGYCRARRARAMVPRVRHRHRRRHYALGAFVASLCVVGFSWGRADGKLTRKRPLKTCIHSFAYLSSELRNWKASCFHFFYFFFLLYHAVFFFSFSFFSSFLLWTMLLSVCPEVDRNLLMKLGFFRFDLVSLTFLMVRTMYHISILQFTKSWFSHLMIQRSSPVICWMK